MTDENARLYDMEDWLLELRTLRQRALARHDLVQAEELRAEIEELTAYRANVFEGA